MAIFKKVQCPYCLHKYNRILHDKCPNCDNIDFENIEEVFIMRVEERYHDEIVEVFDIVSTYDLSQQDGWPHYETEEEVQTIYDGTVYTFLILYKNGTEEIREYEETTIFYEKIKPFVNTQVKEVISEIENVNAIIHDTFTGNQYHQIRNELWNDLMRYQEEKDDDITKFIKEKIKYLNSCTYEEYVTYLRKVLICILCDETEGDIFEDSEVEEIQFIQPVKDKYDAFVLLQRKNDVGLKEVENYLEIKRKYGFRKINVIFNSKLDKRAYSYIQHNEMVLWDLQCIRQLLLMCYEKILLQKIDEKIEELNNED